MANFHDIAYFIGLAAASPYWLIKPSARRKVLGALRQRRGEITGIDHARASILIHAVSLGEMNAIRALVQRLELLRPDINFIVSATTDSGFERAQQLYGAACRVGVARYPLDFSSSVKRFLDAVRPSVVVLVELEMWPNFIHECASRGIPVILINGRVSEGSYRHYRWARLLVRSMFRSMARVCVQDKRYADRFVAMGADPAHVRVTGTMKFDTALVSDQVSGADDLVGVLGLSVGSEPIWVCGSTGPGEEHLILDEYRRLLERFSRLRLVIVPRHKTRFDEVAALIEQHKFKVLRRSQAMIPPEKREVVPPVILGDTIGELRRFYSMADVVFVGRSLVDLGSRQHGSDMIEPAALGKPVVVGPYTANFADAVFKLKNGDGIMEVVDAAHLRGAITALLADPDRAATLGRKAREVVTREQGATERHAQIILDQIKTIRKPATPLPDDDLTAVPSAE